MIINSYTNYLEHFYSNCFNEPLNESWQHYLSKRTLNYTKETLLNELELVENIALNESNLNHDKLYLVHGKNDRIAPLKEIQKLHLKRAITICPNQGHLDALNHIHDRRWLEEILSAK